MKNFQRRTEDFRCEACGEQVTGTGYTNHCPECFYSKHVDINPGDRAASCQGLMKLVDIDFVNDQYVLIHQCQQCGLVRRCKADVHHDNMKKLENLYLTFLQRKKQHR